MDIALRIHGAFLRGYWAPNITIIKGTLASMSMSSRAEVGAQHRTSKRNLVVSYHCCAPTCCRAAEIPCQFVSGRVKEAHCTPGDTVSARKSYSAAFVDGAWRFVDQHWGSSFLIDVADKDRKPTANGGDTNQTGADGQTRTHQHRDDFYFMTDPEMMICTHLPDDPAWQLLARPVTPAEFEQMAYIRDAFFDMGLHSISEPKCVIYTDSGDVTIEVGLPEHAEQTFTYELYKSAWEKTRGRMNGADLNQYVFMDITQKENKLRVRIKFPWIGKYMIKLYGRALGTGFSSELCQYVIHCQKPNFTCSPNPMASRHLWGAGWEAAAVGLVPVNHDGGLIVGEDGQADIVFKMTHSDDLLFKHSLEIEDINQAVLSHYTVHYIIEDEVYFVTKLPQCGKYIFKLFAKRARGHDDFIHVSNYLITSDTESVDQRAFPETETGEIGLVRDNTSVGITPVSHPNPLITCPDAGYMEITMSTHCLADISSQLKRASKYDMDNVSDYTFIEQNGNDITLNVRFPDVGTYLLTISARPLQSESEPIAAFIYVIDVKQHNYWQCTSFPKTLEWSNSFALIEPRSDYLLPNKDVHFALVVPGGHERLLGKTSRKGAHVHRARPMGRTRDSVCRRGGTDHRWRLSRDRETTGHIQSKIMITSCQTHLINTGITHVSAYCQWKAKLAVTCTAKLSCIIVILSNVC